MRNVHIHPWMTDDFLEQCLGIDEATYEKRWPNFERIAAQHPDFYLVVTRHDCEGQIVMGYAALVGLTADAYRALKEGCIAEEDLLPQDSAPLNRSGGIYFASAALNFKALEGLPVDSASRLRGRVVGSGLTRLVMEAQTNGLEVCALTTSPAGDSICDEIEMEYLPPPRSDARNLRIYRPSY